MHLVNKYDNPNTMYRYCFDDPLIYDVVANIMFVFRKKEHGYMYKYDQKELDYKFFYYNGTYTYDLRNNGCWLLEDKILDSRKNFL